MNVNKAVALRISELLLQKGMTLYRLERNSGLSHSRLGCIMGEKNKTVTLATLYKLARGFDMTIYEFLDDDLFRSEELELD